MKIFFNNEEEKYNYIRDMIKSKHESEKEVNYNNIEYNIKLILKCFFIGLGFVLLLYFCSLPIGGV